MAALVVATIVAPVRAHAKTVIDYDPTETINPVADNITRLNVDKLETGSRDQVKGAVLQVIKKETGEVVDEWTSDGTTHEIARNAGGVHGALDIDTVYILREVSVPEGYEKAKDVEFIIHSDDFNTTGEILSGGEDGNAESGAIRGSGPEQAFVISLFDKATMHVTDEERRTRERETQEQQEVQQQTGNRQQSTTSSTTSGTTSSTTSGTTSSSTSSTTTSDGLTQTGDSTSYVPVVVLAVVGAGAIGLAVQRRLG
ncbi:MAG: hypothetical protein Q4A07_06930 [Coriobacteriales bacterium]|nr:hypothetical protein [Coriobacteriales bacterium]